MYTENDVLIEAFNCLRQLVEDPRASAGNFKGEDLDGILDSFKNNTPLPASSLEGKLYFKFIKKENPSKESPFVDWNYNPNDNIDRLQDLVIPAVIVILDKSVPMVEMFKVEGMISRQEGPVIFNCKIENGKVELKISYTY